MGSDQSLDDKNPNDAFSIDLLKEYKTISNKEDRNYLFLFVKLMVKNITLHPLGKGLWAAVWGYIAWMKKERKLLVPFLIINLKPGLGAEISKIFRRPIYW